MSKNWGAKDLGQLSQSILLSSWQWTDAESKSENVFRGVLGTLSHLNRQYDEVTSIVISLWESPRFQLKSILCVTIFRIKTKTYIPCTVLARKRAECEYKRAFLYFDFSAQTPFFALPIVQFQSKQRCVLIWSVGGTTKLLLEPDNQRGVQQGVDYKSAHIQQVTFIGLCRSRHRQYQEIIPFFIIGGM